MSALSQIWDCQKQIKINLVFVKERIKSEPIFRRSSPDFDQTEIVILDLPDCGRRVVVAWSEKQKCEFFILSTKN